jgi:geranylgeranyl diphosphate synthase type 3/geranylgeranyl diphosphate synthase type I
MDENARMMDYLKKRVALVNRKLEESVRQKSSDRYISNLLGKSGYVYHHKAIDKSVLEPANYLLGIGGKRVRAVLMLSVIEALGKNPNNYLEFALVPEVIHNGTLVHDDIEDMSRTRRGREAVHVKYGIDIGTNLGDFLFFFPMVALIDSKKLSVSTKNRALSVYVKEMLKLAVGQAIDLAWHNQTVELSSITERQYLQTAANKTGCTFSLAAQLGGIVAGADDRTVNALDRLGKALGIAFQLQDDVLNISKSSLAENKGGIGDDIKEGKVSLMVVHALRAATEKDRKRLIAILRMHTDDKRHIAEFIGMLEKYGAVEHASRMARRFAREAWLAAGSALPKSEARDWIEWLTDFAVSRNI